VPTTAVITHRPVVITSRPPRTPRVSENIPVFPLSPYRRGYDTGAQVYPVAHLRGNMQCRSPTRVRQPRVKVVVEAVEVTSPLLGVVGHWHAVLKARPFGSNTARVRSRLPAFVPRIGRQREPGLDRRFNDIVSGPVCPGLFCGFTVDGNFSIDRIPVDSVFRNAASASPGHTGNVYGVGTRFQIKHDEYLVHETSAVTYVIDVSFNVINRNTPAIRTSQSIRIYPYQKECNG